MRPIDSADQARASSRAGFFYALSAYCLWGMLPLYMKALDHIAPVEIVAHRIVWSVPVGLVLLLALRHGRELLAALKDRRVLITIAASATLISLNWLAYVQAVVWNVASDAALGYYINPLISVVIGWVMLGEKLAPLQWLAVAIAAAAVLMMVVAGGHLPWLALVMAFSFAIYGYLRKTVAVGPTEGFVLEVLILFPFALGYLTWRGEPGLTVFTADPWLLMGTGLVTAIPLILFAFGAKRLTLSTNGLMQYIAPTLIFIVSIFVFQEPVGPAKVAAFVMIWFALALYSWVAFRPRTTPVPAA